MIERDDQDVRIHLPHAEAIGVCRDRTFFLMLLRVDEAHRGRGFATRLLRILAEWCRDEGLRRIEVDDMTDRQRQVRNVYVLAGFSYVKSYGPEMQATPRAIMRAIDATTAATDDGRA